MANLTNREFVPLDISGKNYLSWALDAEIHLDAKGLGDTIKENNKASSQDRARAMIFIRHHLDEALKTEYLTVKDPLMLWNNLKERYDHLKRIRVPRAQAEWRDLRLQDFKSVSEYNSAMFRITSLLKLSGETITEEDMLEKMYNTFHASNVLLQQQYREKGFTKYSELISCLLLAEQNNEILLMNHESRPTGASPFPEVNVAQSSRFDSGRGRGLGRGRGHGRGRSRGHGHGHGRGKYIPDRYHKGSSSRKGKTVHQKWNRNEVDNQKINENLCYKCGVKGHYSRACDTPKHLVELYQASLKNKNKGLEANLVCHERSENDTDMMDFDVDSFLMIPEGQNDQANV